MFTRQCIAALKQHTRPDWELIVIDNGSTESTCTYLAGVQDGAGLPVTLISNTTNRGFPAAINQGLREAQGEYLVLLNHDLFVHHFGSRTFAGNGGDAERMLDEHAGRFAAKWLLRAATGRRWPGLIGRTRLSMAVRAM